MAQLVKNLLANAGNSRDAGSVSGMGKSPGEGNGNPLQYSCHGQRSLMDYSLCGRKESDRTEDWAHANIHTYIHIGLGFTLKASFSLIISLKTVSSNKVTFWSNKEVRTFTDEFRRAQFNLTMVRFSKWGFITAHKALKFWSAFHPLLKNGKISSLSCPNS